VRRNRSPWAWEERRSRVLVGREEARSRDSLHRLRTRVVVVVFVVVVEEEFHSEEDHIRSSLKVQRVFRSA